MGRGARQPGGAGNLRRPDSPGHGPADGSENLTDAAYDLGPWKRFTHVYIMNALHSSDHKATNIPSMIHLR